MAANRVCLGVITGARGIKGEVRIKSFTEVPADIAAYGPLADESGRRAFALTVTGEATGRQRGVVIGRIEGVTDRDDAEALKGTELFIERAALPATADDEFYYADLIGLRAELASGGALGTVRAVEDYGAGPMLDVATVPEAPTREATVSVPFTRRTVPTVDLEGGRIVVDLPPGLLAPAEAEAETGGEDGETDGRARPERD